MTLDALADRYSYGRALFYKDANGELVQVGFNPPTK